MTLDAEPAALAAERPAADPARSRPPTSRWVLIATCVGYAMVMLDVTAVNVALPALARSLHATTTDLQWVVSGYTLLFAALLLSAGALGDRRGLKGVFLSGLGLFCFASLICALAPSAPALVAARLLQGAAAAVAVPSSLALVQSAYPDRASRARAVGMWGAMAGIAAGLGPLLGGALVDIFGWRSVFFVNLPVGAIGIAIGARQLPRPPRHHQGLDVAGQIAAVMCLGALALALIEAGRHGWTSPLVLGGLAIFALGAVLFIVVERTVEEPMLPLQMFSSPRFSTATAVGLLANLGFFGELFVMSLYLQRVRGLSPLLAGIALTPQMAITVIGSVISGRVAARTGPRLPMLIGLGVGSAGLFGLIAAGAGTPYWALIVCFGAAGFGISFAMMAATGAVMQVARVSRGGIASGTLNAARQVGGMIGVAIFGSLVVDRASFISGLRVSMAIAGAAFLLGAVLTALFVGRRTYPAQASSSSRSACSEPDTGSTQGSNRPSCTRTEA